VVALVVGVAAGFGIGRATDGGTPKRTVNVTRTFINPAAGQTGTWAESAIRRNCAGDVSVVRVTITRVTARAGVVEGATTTKSYNCKDFMQHFFEL